MQLELTPLELNMLNILYGAYVCEQPDEDAYTQQMRDALAVKLSHFDGQVMDAQAEQITLVIDPALLREEF